MHHLHMQYLPTVEEQRWLTRYMRRLIENMGYEQFVLAPILEPSRKWFPERWDATIYDAHLITQRLMHYAGLDDLRFVIEGFIARDDLNTKSGDASGYFTGIRDGVAYFGLKQETMRDPEIAAGTMAHEVAHAWRTHHRERLEHIDDQEEILTDITTVYLGFGLLTTNDTYRFRSSGNSRVQQWGSSSYGYLPMQAMSFLLGMQLAARNREDEIDGVLEQLEPNQQRAVRETLEHFETLDIVDLLALPPRDTWPEPDREPHDIRLIEPDEKSAIEIEDVPDNPLRNQGQWVYRDRRDAAIGQTQRWIVGIPLLGMFAIFIAFILKVDNRILGIALGILAVILVIALIGGSHRIFVCSDTNCRHRLSGSDTICPGCAGHVAANADEALERNSETAEFIDCDDCEAEQPCARHA